MKLRSLLWGCAIAVGLIGQIHAAAVNWTIDSSQSYIRLNIPDQIINIGGGNVLPVAMRDQGANPGSAVASSWTDAGKRLAGLSGTISSNMTANSISFTSGTHAAPAVASGLWRPDAASWDGSTFNTGLGATTPSVFAADLTVQGLLRAAFLNFYNVNTDYAGTATGLVNYAGAGSGSYNTGALAGTTMDLDALTLITDGRSSLAALIGTVNLGSNGSLSINDLGGLNRELVMNHNVGFVVLINGLPVNASFDSQVVARAIVPEPTAAALVGVALSLVSLRRRRSI